VLPDLPKASHTVAEWVHGYAQEEALRGFRCTSCGLITATWGLACARCGHRALVEQPLGRTGRVVAFTILNVPGDEFLNDAPYAYVVVELDEGGRITGWMPSVRSVRDLAVGQLVRFVAGYKPGVQFVKADGPE
jgi:uncharacterized protein